ncbi:hypothetical protein HDA32_004631 [Spinactinospora alkalitolerans]|uniref:STI1 domain-containing protein n=1 Tax=Spinactinospora alkalitolerans TaxID=687207 RepID=A0A852U093_9ACTN|nr:hypothetical protein [Spinactinospora alkalitolerans]NYE49511.1 hypothetical protein [Spinactinospora alkalitolerans]
MAENSTASWSRRVAATLATAAAALMLAGTAPAFAATESGTNEMDCGCPPGMRQMMQSPAMQEMMQNPGMAEMMQNPGMAQMMEDCKMGGE